MAQCCKAASPPFGAMVKEQAELEGQYRFVHSRLIANAEEVAFYGGEAVERASIWGAYVQLSRHVNTILRKRIFYHVVNTRVSTRGSHKGGKGLYIYIYIYTYKLYTK